MNRLFSFLFVIVLCCFFSAVVMGQNPFGVFDQIKQKIQPSEEKGKTQEKQPINTNQNTGVNQRQEAPPTVETEKKESVTTIKEFETKITATDTGNNPLKIFDIPLNATVQETIDVLEKKGIELDNTYDKIFIPVDSANDMKRFKDQLNKKMANHYQNVNPAKKDEATKILNEKVKYFQFKYKGKECLLYPKSLNSLPDLEGLYPLFDKYYDIYNSIFILTAGYDSRDSLSPDMKSQKIVKMLIAFVSVGQEVPRSFLINLKFDSTEIQQETGGGKLFSVFTEKYGEPILYYFYRKYNIESGEPGDADIVDLLLKKYKNSREVKEHFTLYPGLVTVISISCPHADYFTGSCSLYSIPFYRLEWNYEGNKIIYNSRFSEDATKDVPNIVSYIYCPLGKEVEDMFSKLFSESKSENKNLKSEASSKF